MRAVITIAMMLGLVAPLRAQTRDSANDVVGLWKAKRYFGPAARGPLLLQRSGNTYTAEMMGFRIPVTVREGELLFELPNREGGFRGKLQSGGSIRGIWFAAPLGSLGGATPVTLLPKTATRWEGDVVPLEETQTFYLLVRRQPEGSLSAMLRNPERDYGAALGVRGVVRNGSQISLLGRRGAQTRDTVLLTGTYDTTMKVITFNFPFRGGSYDFRRDDDDQSDFYPRGKRPTRYVYHTPPALDDGWATASVNEVGIDRMMIERM
ncbi:MAG TPA: hypothetical protein VGD49_08735, partial [Longimicrobiales bacterium]